MQYNLVLGSCPNCGTRPLTLWRRMIDWRWPLPLAIGLALQVLLYCASPQRTTTATMKSTPEAAMISQFIASALIFAALAALLLFAATRIRKVMRRSGSRR
jgi:hypothetical protein